MNSVIELSIRIVIHASQATFEGFQSFKTPAFLYYAGAVVREYRQLGVALGTPVVVSLKANSFEPLLDACAPSFVDGVEVASLGELQLALRCGFKSLYLNTPCLERELLQAGLAAGATVILDGIDQAHLLRSVAEQAPVSVMLRLNPVSTHSQYGQDYPLSDHFGMAPRDAVAVAAILAPTQAKVQGVHMFCGSNSFTTQALPSLRILGRVLADLEAALGYELRVVNAGGGFPANWRERPDVLTAYTKEVASVFASRTVLHEAGRAVFGRAGVFLCRIVSTKHLGDSLIAICDGGMSQSFLLARTESPLRRYCAPVLYPSTSRPPAAAGSVIFAGGSCNREDVIGRWPSSQMMPQAGDLVAFPNCGAYASVYGSQRFLSLREASKHVLTEDIPPELVS